MANLIPNITKTYFDDNGEVLAGGKIYSYAAGTTTPLATYTDSSEGTENTNPVILDANGQADIWIGASAYKFVITDADDVEIKTVDNVAIISNGSVTTAKLADGSVTTPKIADLNVTTAKLADLGVTAAKLSADSVTTAKVLDSAITSAKLADDAVTSAKLNDDIYSGVFTERNKFINGDMEIWQRDITFSPVAANDYTADRWRWRQAGAMVYSIQKEDLIKPSFASPDNAGYVFNNSMKIDVTTADATVAAGDLAEIAQPIEGTFFKDLIKKEIVHTFWIRSNVVKTLCVAFKNGITDSFISPPTKSYVAPFTINAIDTWQKVTTVIPAPTDGSWNSDKGSCGLYASLVLTCGTTFQTTAGAWQNGNYSGTSTMGNFSDDVANIMYVTGFRLEGGSIPRQYDSRHPAFEQLLCNRYFESITCNFKAYNPNVSSADSIGGLVPFSTPKAVTGSLYDSFATTQTKCTGFSASVDLTGVDFQADFTASGAGAAELEATALVEAELEI